MALFAPFHTNHIPWLRAHWCRSSGLPSCKGPLGVKDLPQTKRQILTVDSAVDWCRGSRFRKFGASTFWSVLSSPSPGLTWWWVHLTGGCSFRDPLSRIYELSIIDCGIGSVGKPIRLQKASVCKSLLFLMSNQMAYHFTVVYQLHPELCGSRGKTWAWPVLSGLRFGWCR